MYWMMLVQLNSWKCTISNKTRSQNVGKNNFGHALIDFWRQIDEGGVEVIYDRMRKLLENTDSINQSDIDDIRMVYVA